MLSALFGPAAEARRLGRDVHSILEATRLGQRQAVQARMALDTREALAESHRRGGADAQRYGPIIEHFRMRHREARGARDEVALTACTLVIIYLRAEQLGDAAAPARAAIDAFVAEWAHLDPAQLDALGLRA